MTPPKIATPRAASTLVLLRDGAEGLEVLLLRRAVRAGDRSSGAWVFPGGTVDATDRSLHPHCVASTDARASERLNVAEHGLDFYVCAIRECFEEAGVLLASDASGRPIDAPPERLDEQRARLRRGDVDFGALCDALGVRLAADRLAYFSHWLTPPGLPKRFDTRFFVAAMPPGQTVIPDRDETLDHCWLRPADALARAAELKLPNPTRRTLKAIEPFADALAVVEHANAQRDIVLTMPLIADGAAGLRPVHPDEPAYAEIARIDPYGEGRARYAIEPARPLRLSPRIVRVTAPNAGVMTGPGTNTYLVGHPHDDVWAAIDPGPADEAHVDAIVAAAPGPIRWILVTHTHKDHSPAAPLLKARTGAALLGMRAPDAARHDVRFVPDRALGHGAQVSLGPATTLRALHTPGHASNHLCYLLVEERTLFTGDHVMQGSTVVIDPPDGDMGAYLASLRALQREALDVLAPGHGFLIGDPQGAIERLILHRLAREAKVLAALQQLGPAPLDALLPQVYDDVPATLHPVAQRSLLAHLLWLQAQGRAVERPATWAAV
jgi:glyoxylase-like metal-dependent hydrolase (beta-lactamase superfamily II)/8-oxo-dGTP pyrophosphatase MutT (NUDIX family)